ncbi:hypothetical protein BC939DRAFT_41378 [Gamsiella multidivaricata]|uniref:uncharacterized protein n=1 Tax=Gamsiella multidivaricata TaxID=101098 RepID=UPI00221E4CB6|nr:uncharacterized protein BC939DRAFT_41378 [Gamsiella multidivaricata]KAI7816534.1 hypothetical protein BC939DRAFT_41378 [Gamsiella multidivaricata]
MDDHGSSNSQPTAISGAFSHPLPPKPQPVQSRQSSTDQTPSQSAAAAISSAKTSEQDHSSSPSSANSSATSVTQASSNKLTPPPTGTPAGTSSAPASSSPPSATIAKNPLKLSQVPEHLQPIKSWMTVSPIPRAPLGDKGTKTFRGERRDSRDSIAGSTSPRSTSSVSRKSSLSVTESAKEVPATPAVATAPKVADIAEDSTNVMESVSVAAQRASSAAHENQPQTPTPAHTPTPAGTSRSAVPLALPPTLSYPPVNVSPPNLILSNEEEKTTDVQQIVGDSTPDGKSQSAPAAALITSAPIKTSAQDAEPSVLGKRTVALSLSADDRSEDTFTRRRKLSDGALPSRKMESSVTDIETPQPTPAQPLNPTSSSPLAPPNMSPHVTKRSPLLSPLSSPGAVAVGPADRQPSRLLDSPDHSAIADTRSFNDVSQHQDSTPAESDVSRFGEESAYVKIEPIMPKKSNQRMKQEPFVAALGENVEVTNIAGSTAVTTGPLPTPALTMAEQMAYQAPTNQEKALVMARARSAMMSRLEIQMEEQAAKETKMAEDIERFKKMSRLRKEKAQKRKLQEANEAPVQDRRAQPVRLINQQQGRQSNSDSPSLRSQTQGTQRQGSSPQDQQRLSYTTRQSKAASRIETQQSAQNSPRTQSRSAQYSGQQKGLNQSLGDPAPQPPTQRDQRTMPSESDSPNQGRIDQQASGVPNSNLRPPEETVRLHRRINSMDHHLRTSQSLNSLRPDPTAPDQRELAEQLYGQPHSKRLDLGQHGETNHRRSHSDVGVLYKPVVTAIVQPQPTAREHPQTAARRDFPPIHHNPRVNKHDMEYFQSVYSPQGLGGPAPFQSDVDGARMRGNSAFTSGANEAALAKRESKTRLQFILNDEDSEPESRSDEDFPSREAPHWGQRNPSQEHPQRGNAASMEYGGRSSYAHEYSVPGHRGMHVGPGTPPSVVDPNMTRHQQAKKQKLSQELIGMGQHVNTRTEEYEHQLRKAQIQSQSPRTVAPPSQRGGPQADRWTQQAHAQYPAPPPHMHTKSPSQPLPSGRRVSGEAPLMTPQLISHPPSRSMYSGAEQPQHGNPPTNRAVHHDQYPHPGSATAQESPRPNPDRPTHSRHSSLSKPGIVPPEHGHSHGSPHQGGRVKSSQVQPEQYARVYPSAPVTQSPGQQRTVSHAHHQQQPAQPSYHPQHQQQQQRQQQQQQMMVGGSSRKKAQVEHHPGTYGSLQGAGAHAGYEARPAHPQHMHPQQQQHLPLSRHSEQESLHDLEPQLTYHKQPQASGQYRGVHHDQVPASGNQGYYEQEAHAGNFGSGRSSAYDSQSLHPSSAQERQGASYPPHHGTGAPHDPTYRLYPGGGARSALGNELAMKEDHTRGGPGARGSMGHLPSDHQPPLHSSQRQYPQHAPPHPQQQQQQQQEQQHALHDFRHGPVSYHQQQQQQYPAQQKLMHVQDHPQYPPPHNNSVPKHSSPRHGQQVGGHPGEHDPNYRPQALQGLRHVQGHGHGHAHGHDHGHGHSGPPW